MAPVYYRGVRRLCLAPALFAIAAFIWATYLFTGAFTRLQIKVQQNILTSIKNNTLGFQKVFVVSLASRTDKRDAITLASSLTGFDVEWIDGIDGNNVPKKSIPSIFNPGTASKVIGCWRAHMNSYATIVKNHVSSALILEDDADWDVSLKNQLQNFAVGSQILQGENTHPLRSAYGDNWDLLWLGHCGSSPHPDDPRRYAIENDPTVPPIKHRVNEVDTPDMGEFSDTTRIVYTASSGFCMYGYAVSYQGAQKLLYHLSLQPYFEAVDLSIQRMCGDTSYNFTCISIFPQLFNSHRAAGSMEKDSDIGGCMY